MNDNDDVNHEPLSIPLLRSSDELDDLVLNNDEDFVSAASSQSSSQSSPEHQASRSVVHPGSLLKSKLTYFRKLEQDWVRLSPSPTLSSVSDQDSTMAPLDLAPPPHVLPAKVYVWNFRNPTTKQQTSDDSFSNSTSSSYQSSVSTIFSIWNTMIGSTLVALPYGFSQSGLITGVVIVTTIGAICCYTCILVVQYSRDFGDYGDLVQYYFGRRAQVLTMIVSVSVLLGACIAYHVLMAESLYALGRIMFSNSHHWTPSAASIIIFLTIFPLTILKNVSTLVLLNSFGIPFVLYTMYFIMYHGVQALFSCRTFLSFVVVGGKSSAGVLGGIVTLSFFIHNAIQPIIRNSNPSTQKRDVTLAFVFVGISYLVVGVLGYAGFATSSSSSRHNISDSICFESPNISQNFLDAFPSNNVFAVSARASLLLQLATVYPLVLLIIRTQFFGLLCRSPYPNVKSVGVLNGLIMTITTAVAILYPNVGDILRFTGAFGGLVMIFMLPIGIYLKRMFKKRRRKKISWLAVVFHFSLIAIGSASLALQFYNPEKGFELPVISNRTSVVFDLSKLKKFGTNSFSINNLIGQS